MILQVSSLSNEERLYKCGILCRKMRRLLSDLILVPKIMKGFVKVKADKFFQFLEDLHTTNIQEVITSKSLNRPAG